VEPLRQVSVQGTQTTYVDRDFVRDRLAGVLEVTVLRAAGLKRSDWWPGSKSDPYAVVTVGGSSGRTPALPNTLEPAWGHRCEVFVRDLGQQRLLLRVLDADVAGSDDLLGAGMRGLGDLGDGAPREVDIGLGTGAGAATLRLRFQPFTDALLDEAAGGRMGGPVLGSPANALLASPWRDVKAALIPAAAAADAAFDPVAFLDAPATDTQAWLFTNPALRRAVVAFRGTEQAKWRDVLTDLSAVPSTLDPEGSGVGGDSAAPGPKGLDALRRGLARTGGDLGALLADSLRGGAAPEQGQEQRAWVHSGFAKAYASVRADVQQLIDTAVGRDAEPWTVYVTGHSLGGALSTLCAYDVAGRTRWAGAAPRVVVYNYGSPRVGNAVFAAEFNARVPNCWRVTNRADAVTQVPRLLGYCHVGHCVTLAPGGGALVEWHTSGSPGEGAEVGQLAMSTMAAALGAAGAAAEVAELIKAEVAAMDALLDGSAVEEHLEPLYLANLSAAVGARRGGGGGGGDGSDGGGGA
jgi:hypothetical protein